MNARSLRQFNESGSPASRVAAVLAVFLLIALQLPMEVFSDEREQTSRIRAPHGAPVAHSS